MVASCASFLVVFFMLLMGLNCDDDDACSRIEECYWKVNSYKVDGRRWNKYDLTRQSVYDDFCSLVSNALQCVQDEEPNCVKKTKVYYPIMNILSWSDYCSPAERDSFTDSCFKINGCSSRLLAYQVYDKRNISKYFTIWDLVEQAEVYDFYCQMASDGAKCVEDEMPNCNGTDYIQDSLGNIRKWELVCSSRMKPALMSMSTSNCYGNYSAQDLYSWENVAKCDPNKDLFPMNVNSWTCETLYTYRDCIYNEALQVCGASFAYIMANIENNELRPFYEYHNCTDIAIKTTKPPKAIQELITHGQPVTIMNTKTANDD